MNEQVLKDLVATAQKYNYNWSVIIPKFPELKQYNSQLLKDYVATAEKYKYNYSVVNGKFPEFNLKKKEATASPSKRDQKLTSSATQPKTNLKPSVSSSSTSPKTDGKPDGLYQFPGNNKAVYKKQGGEWYVDPYGGRKFTKLYKGDVKSRVDLLEKKATKVYEESFDFKFEEKPKQAPIVDKKEEPKEKLKREMAQDIFEEEFFVTPKKNMSPTEQVDFVARERAIRELGKDASEDQLKVAEEKYKTSETLKMLKRKGYDVDVNGSLDDPKVKKALAEFNANEAFRLNAEGKQNILDKNIDNIINSKLMGATEEYTVPLLNKNFGKYGFIFEETGVGDAMTVRYTTDNGLTYSDEFEIDLQSGDPNVQMNKLKSFMKGKYLNDYEKSALNDENLTTEQLITTMASDPKKYGDYMLSEGEFETYMTRQYRDVAQYQKEINFKINEFDKLKQQYQETGDENTLAKLKELDSTIKADQKKLIYRESELEQIGEKYRQSVGEYVSNKGEEGNFIGGITSSFAKGVTSGSKALLYAGMDAVAPIFIEDIVNPIEYSKLKEEGLSDSEISDKVTSQVKRTIVKDINEGITNIGSLGTVSEEYFGSKDRNLVEKALFGLAESVGAGITGATNKTAQALSFFAMSYNAMQDEFSSEEFDSMSNLEKQMWSGVYGLVIGQLEKIGFNVASGQTKSPLFKKFASNVIMNAIKEAPEDAAIETIDQLIGTSVKNTLKATGIKVANGMISEGTTEGVQSLFETSMKGVINEIHKKKLFSYVPDLTTKEGVKYALETAAEEFAAGAIGGAVMGSYDSYTKIPQNKRTDQDFLKLYTVVNDNILFKSLKINEIEKYKNGDISLTELKDKISSINETAARINKIPENLNVRSKRIAFDLMNEKESLNKSIQGKDANLVKPQLDRIAEIDNQLKKIGEDAAKESKQPVEEVTAEGGGVQYQGTKEGQPEVGQGKGTVGETTQPETDLGNRPVESRSEEEIDKLIEERIGKYSIQPNDLFADMSEADNNIIEKASKGESVDINALNGTIDYLYKKYKEITSLKKNKRERLNKSTTISVLNNIQQDIENDLDFLMTYKGEVEQGNNPITIEEFNNRPTSDRKVFMEESPLVEQAATDTAQVETAKEAPITSEALTQKRNEIINSEIKKLQDEISQSEDGDYKTLTQEILKRLQENPIMYFKTEMDFAKYVGDNAEYEYHKSRYEELLNYSKATETTQEQATPTTQEQVVAETAPVEQPTTATVEQPVVDQPVTEQPQAEQVSASRLEELGKVIEGTPQQIDEQVDSIRLDNSNSRVANSIKSAAKAISKILPDVKFIVHDNEESYKKAVGNTSRGYYNPTTMEIHINLKKANNRTAVHEVFHAIILSSVKNDAEAQRLTKAMITSVIKSLVNMKDAGKILKYLQDFESGYKENIRDEEKLAELTGILFDNFLKLPAPTQNIIQRWLDRLAKLFGLKPLTDKETIDFINYIATSVVIEDEMQDYMLPTKIAKTISEMNGRFQADFTDPISKLTFVYDKNSNKFDKLEKDGYITKDKSLSDFNGKYMLVHQPDTAFSGFIYKDGKILVEGKGGVFYPIKFHEDGYFWASTKDAAVNMSKRLNDLLAKNNGTIYMALVSSKTDKLFSSTTMSNAILDFFISKSFDKNFKINKSQVKDALINAANYVKTVKSKNQKGEIIEKQVGLNLKLNKSDSLENIISKIKASLSPDFKVFSDRKEFSEQLAKNMADIINKNNITQEQFSTLFSDGIQNKYFKGTKSAKTNTIKLSKANIIQALGEMFTEPMLKEGINREKGGQVYAVIELNGPVKPVDSNKHESYPKAVQSDSNAKAKIHILKDRFNWSDSFEDPETNKIIEGKRASNILPSNVGMTFEGIKVNTSKVDTEAKTEEKSVRNQIDNSFEARNQNAPTNIASIIKTARENGFTDQEITQYLLQQGYDQDKIDTAMKFGIASGTSIDDVFETSTKELESKLKKGSIGQRLITGIRSLRKSLIDRQTDIKRSIKGIKNTDAINAYNKLVNKAGATGFASLRYKLLSKKIYGGLNEEKLNALDKIIYARRIISVNENRIKKGLEPYRGIKGYSETDAQNDLVKLRTELGDKTFDNLSKRADDYFNVFAENLLKLKDSGRISEEVYNELKDIEYSPIKTIKYIIKDNYNVNDLDNEAAKLGISKKDIMALGDRNENGIITDSKWLLMMNISSVESRVFENRMLNDLVAALKNATAQEKSDLADYFIFDNPIIGNYKDGRPKRKYDEQKLPDGYRKVHYFENGVDRYLIVSENAATQLMNVKNSKIMPAIEDFSENTPILGWLAKHLILTPTRLLRFFATGGNPMFILGNVPMDWTNAVFFSDVYSNVKLIGMVQAGTGFSKNFLKKIWKDFSTTVLKGDMDKVYMEYAEHGGLMDTMSQEGMRNLEKLKPKGKLLSVLPKTIIRPTAKFTIEAPYKILKAYGSVLSYMGETSEVAFRLAVYKKTKNNLIREFKKKNNVAPNSKQLDDIMWNAAREARELIDFNQGGTWAKELDVFMPYFNAAMQGVRRPLDFARKNPLGFSTSMLQLAGMAGSLVGLSLSLGMSAFADDDEEEKKKKIKNALNSISTYEKANYHIIFTGKKDENGELEYIRIKKLPVASIISTFAEELVYNKLLGYNIDYKNVSEAVSKSSPLSLSELGSKNPFISGIIAYAYNIDTFTGEEIVRLPKDKKINITAEGMFDDKVEGLYKTLAPQFGMSPARTKAFVEKIITTESTNPTINLFYAVGNGIFDPNTTFGNELSLLKDEIVKQGSKKLIRYTNKNIIKYNLEDELEKKEMDIETEIYLKEQSVYNKIKKSAESGKKMSEDELIDVVVNSFDEQDHERYYEKYMTYMRNMDVDKSLLDLIYEDNPKVTAMKLFERYGSNLGDEEIKELVKVMDASGRKLSEKALQIYEKEY